MPYLPTSQAFLEQSSMLLEAYPDDTRITTKYSYPSHLPPSSTKKSKTTAEDSSGGQQQTPAATTTAPAAPIATLTFKTYNPATGICLKYRTNKAAEVGRLMTGLGKLASGAKVSDLTTTAAAATTAGGDVEMTDAPAPAPEENADVVTTATTAGKADAGAGGKGGKSKKKSGKGKR